MPILDLPARSARPYLPAAGDDSRTRRTVTPAGPAATAAYPASRAGGNILCLVRKPQAQDRAGSGPPVMFPLRVRVHASTLPPQPRRAASIAAMSIFLICIIASNASLAAAGSALLVGCRPPPPWH